MKKNSITNVRVYTSVACLQKYLNIFKFLYVGFATETFENKVINFLDKYDI